MDVTGWRAVVADVRCTQLKHLKFLETVCDYSVFFKHSMRDKDEVEP